MLNPTPVARFRRRLGAAVAILALAGSTVPAVAGINPAGVARVDADLPFVSGNVDFVGTIPMQGVIGATFRDNVMYATGQNGVQTFDISNPAVPVPLGKLPLPHFENEDVTIGGNTLLVAADQFVGFLNTIYIIDISDPRVLTLRSRASVPFKAHTVTCLADCRYAYIAGQTGLGLFDTQLNQMVKTVELTPGLGGTHDVWVDSAGVAWVAAGNGTYGYDISDVFNPKLVARTDARGNLSPYNDFIQHNSWRPNVPGTDTPGDVLLITEEDYTTPRCNGEGSFQAWKINTPAGGLTPTNVAVMEPLDLWTSAEGTLPNGEDRSAQNVECSAHWFEERNGYVGIGWYNNGTRFLDVRNPSDIRQVGYYVPTTTSVWGGAVYWAPNPTNANDIAYSLDASRGIDVLRVDVTKPDTSLIPAERATAKTVGPEAAPHPVYGWACPVPASALG